MATVATCGVVLQHEAMVDEVDTAKDEVARVARAHGMARSRATAQDFAVPENALRSIQERFGIILHPRTIEKALVKKGRQTP